MSEEQVPEEFRVVNKRAGGEPVQDISPEERQAIEAAKALAEGRHNEQLRAEMAEQARLAAEEDANTPALDCISVALVFFQHDGGVGLIPDPAKIAEVVNQGIKVTRPAHDADVMTMTAHLQQMVSAGFVANQVGMMLQQQAMAAAQARQQMAPMGANGHAVDPRIAREARRRG